jgi:hypothetical protein
MSKPKKAPRETAADSRAACGGAPEERTPQSETKPDPAPSLASAGGGKTGKADSRKVVNDVLRLPEVAQEFVDKLLQEGSTFEDVVEAVNARGPEHITLNAVQTYFQGNRVLQTQRARRQVEDAEALLESVDKDPKSAEARLARATFLTGYSRVNRNASVVTPREAARYRLECDNLNLKHQILTLQRKKADQDLEYSKAKTALIKATGAKVQREILGLERELRARQAAGDPVGNDVLQKIQQLYGLACQPLLEEVVVSDVAKA